MRLFEDQFPQAIDLIASSLRAGHAFTTGVSMVADEVPDPTGAEFRLLYDQQNYGMPLPDALKAFARRVPLLDARFFITAVLTQREAGGNLAEVLDNLSTLIRERSRVKRQVRVASAHGRITGWVLSLHAAGACRGHVLMVAPDHMQDVRRGSARRSHDHRCARPAGHRHACHSANRQRGVLRGTYDISSSLSRSSSSSSPWRSPRRRLPRSRWRARPRNAGACGPRTASRATVRAAAAGG